MPSFLLFCSLKPALALPQALGLLPSWAFSLLSLCCSWWLWMSPATSWTSVACWCALPSTYVASPAQEPRAKTWRRAKPPSREYCHRLHCSFCWSVCPLSDSGKETVLGSSGLLISDGGVLKRSGAMLVLPYISRKGLIQLFLWFLSCYC